MSPCVQEETRNNSVYNRMEVFTSSQWLTVTIVTKQGEVRLKSDKKYWRDLLDLSKWLKMKTLDLDTTSANLVSWKIHWFLWDKSQTTVRKKAIPILFSLQSTHILEKLCIFAELWFSNNKVLTLADPKAAALTSGTRCNRSLKPIRPVLTHVFWRLSAGAVTAGWGARFGGACPVVKITPVRHVRHTNTFVFRGSGDGAVVGMSEMPRSHSRRRRPAVWAKVGGASCDFICVPLVWPGR